MKFKKYISSILILGACITSTMSLSFADEVDDKNLQEMSSDEIIQYQLDAFDSVDKEIRENRQQIETKNGKSTRAYPTRKGTFLVTKDGKLGELVGHAGMVYSSKLTVESFPGSGKGVGTYSNTWNSKYKTVYGLSSKNVPASKDSAAADYAYAQKGKPYNSSFSNTETTSKFYCSQLVYKAFKEKAGINLNQGGWIVFPIDLVQSSNSYTIYTKGV